MQREQHDIVVQGENQRAEIVNLFNRRESNGFLVHHSTRKWVIVVVTCVVVWLLMRILFFVGLTGSDDLYYMRFAALWDRTPVNDWEARLLGNAATALSMKLFGRNVLAATLPSWAASATLLICVLYATLFLAGIRQAWYAGMLVAVLPLDVDMATTISPHTLMAAMMAAGTVVFLTVPHRRWGRIIAGLLLSLGVITHFVGIYYVAALVIASWCVDRRRYINPIITTCILGLILLAADLAVFHFAFGDAFCRFRVCLSEVNTPKPFLLQNTDGTLNLQFLYWPLQNVLYSKAFGVTLLVVMVTGLWKIRTLHSTMRILLFTTILLWLWISFGSQVPWAYKPFLRINRFLHPLIFTTAILFAAVFVGRRRTRLATVAALFVWGGCCLNLLGSGSWNQGVRISRELLAYVHEHPDQQFITDYHTLNEMYILNGVNSIPRVVTTQDFLHSRLLDRKAKQIRKTEIHHYDAILCNPLNVSRTPTFSSLLARYAGTLQYETSPVYRSICLLLPSLREHPWALRKPPARVFRCIDPKMLRMVSNGHPERTIKHGFQQDTSSQENSFGYYLPNREDRF